MKAFFIEKITLASTSALCKSEKMGIRTKQGHTGWHGNLLSATYSGYFTEQTGQ
jgi:hypothetical protein